MKIVYTIITILMTLLTAAPLNAGTFKVASGTGFFVSKFGHIITNEHVVKGCKRVSIRGAVKPAVAEVLASDADIDLALLKADVIPPRFSPIRSYGSDIGAGDGVLVMGYPGKHGRTGRYKIVESEVMDVKGPMGHDKWIQFTDAAQEGNSGGPLLDLSGNVVGVVVGKTVLTRKNLSNGKDEVIQRSDIAISLPYLTKFLDKHRVQYWKMYSRGDSNKAYIEQNAKSFIVNIHCLQR